MKKSLVLALVAVLVLSFASMAFAFTDTTSHWANAYINKLVDAKVLSGVTATTFAPDAKVTRAEFAKMIVGAKGLALENPATATFSDVATTAWYFPYVEAAAKAKLIDGVGAGKFDPTALVTREQVAKMVVLAAGLKADATKAINFDDAASISDWAKGFVAVAADAKLVTGYNNKFSPKANATRAEAAKLVYEEMLYEGKITPVAEAVPAGYKKVTETPTDSASIELDGTAYDIKSTNFKIAGEFVDDARLFIEGTLVKVTFNSDDEVLSIEADPQVVKGEVTGKGTVDGDRALDVAGKTVVWLDDEDYALATTNPITDFFGYGNIAIKDNVVVLLNKDGKGYAAFAADDTTAKGALTAAGKTADDEFYFVVDGKKYLSTDDSAWTQVTFKIYKNDGSLVTGANSTTFDALVTFLADDDAVAKLTFDAKGKVTKVTAFTEEASGTPVLGYWSEDFTYDSKTYRHLVKIGNLTIGEKTIYSASAEVYAQEKVRILNSSAVVTVNGTKIDFEDINSEIETPADYNVTATVNGSGEVVSLVFTDDTVLGQVSAFTEDSNEKVTKVTIAGKEYTLEDKILNTSDAIKKGYLVKGTLNTAGKLVLALSDIYQAEYEQTPVSLSKFQQYNVVATSFKAGTDMVDATKTSTVTAAGKNVRVQNADTGVVSEIAIDTFVKGATDVKLATVNVNDTLILVADGPDAGTAYDYAVVAPITSTK